MAREIRRFTVNLTKSVADKVDEYAESMGINRTAAVSVLLSQALDTQKAMDNLEKLLQAYEQEKTIIKLKP